jgi:hypothetical protein
MYIIINKDFFLVFLFGTCSYFHVSSLPSCIFYVIEVSYSADKHGGDFLPVTLGSRAF